MPRLNNDEQNQAIGMLNAGKTATVTVYLGTLVVLKRLSSVYREDSMSHETLQTLLEAVDKCCDDRFLQHLRNRHLTAAVTRREYCIHPDCQKSVETKLSVKFLSDVMERQGGIVAAVTCTSDLLIGI